MAVMLAKQNAQAGNESESGERYSLFWGFASREHASAMTDRFYPRLFAIVALAILAWVLFKIFVPFLGPILWSILLAFLLEPINLKLKRRVPGPDGLLPRVVAVGGGLH